MQNKIKHVGIVERVDRGCVSVRIVQSSACAACKAAQQCHASESKEKTVLVYTGVTDYSPGQNVLVMASYGVGMFAVCLAMLIPMLLMILTLFVMISVGYAEMVSALVSLGILIPYYIILYLFRNQINRRVSFSIEKIDAGSASNG